MLVLRLPLGHLSCSPVLLPWEVLTVWSQMSATCPWCPADAYHMSFQHAGWTFLPSQGWCIALVAQHPSLSAPPPSRCSALRCGFTCVSITRGGWTVLCIYTFTCVSITRGGWTVLCIYTKKSHHRLKKTLMFAHQVMLCACRRFSYISN